jgi:hypothetical protein
MEYVMAQEIPNAKGSKFNTEAVSGPILSFGRLGLEFLARLA